MTRCISTLIQILGTAYSICLLIMGELRLAQSSTLTTWSSTSDFQARLPVRSLVQCPDCCDDLDEMSDVTAIRRQLNWYYFSNLSDRLQRDCRRGDADSCSRALLVELFRNCSLSDSDLSDCVDFCTCPDRNCIFERLHILHKQQNALNCMLKRAWQPLPCAADNCCQFLHCVEQISLHSCQTQIQTLDTASLAKLRWYFRSHLIRRGALSAAHCVVCMHPNEPELAASSISNTSGSSSPSSSSSSSSSSYSPFYNNFFHRIFVILFVCVATARWTFDHVLRSF